MCVCVCVSQDYMDQGQTKGFLYNVKHMFDLRDVVQDMGHVSVTHTHTHTLGLVSLCIPWQMTVAAMGHGILAMMFLYDACALCVCVRVCACGHRLLSLTSTQRQRQSPPPHRYTHKYLTQPHTRGYPPCLLYPARFQT